MADHYPLCPMLDDTVPPFCLCGVISRERERIADLIWLACTHGSDQLGHACDVCAENSRLAGERKVNTMDHLAPVQGRCPTCGWGGLYLAVGGYVTCSHHRCLEPDVMNAIVRRSGQVSEAVRILTAPPLFLGEGPRDG